MANANGWGDGASNNNIGWGKGADNAIGWGDIHADSYAGLTDIVGAVAFTGLLDTYSGAAVAYSLRQLRTAYSGNAIRVRRSSDNAEQDFGFVANVLDTASLLTFCGVGNGFVTTWYDQSGSANDATQSTAANQAQIVSSGAMITDVDTSKITTTWTSDRYNLTTGIDPNTKYLSVSVARRQTTSGILIGIGVDNVLGGTNGQSTLVWLSSGSLRGYMPSTVIHNTITTADGYIITSEKNGSNLKTMYLNGSAQPTTATEAPSAGNNINMFGQAGGNITFGQYQEYIYWNSEQSANRTGIESDINTFYTIY
jgi:hypothetical protein